MRGPLPVRAALAMAAVVVAVVLLRTAGVGVLAPVAAGPLEAAGSDRGSAASPRADAPPAAADTARREATAPPAVGARLLLDVVDRIGGPVAGTVSWHATATPPLTLRHLAPEQGHALPDDGGAGTLEHTGAATLLVPAGSWTWVRAAASRLGAAYVLVPPFTGEQNLRLELREDARRIHALVLSPDLTHGAAGEEVLLYRLDMRQTPAPELVARERTDGQGYVRFERLTPEGYLLCPAGASPKDRFPRIARIMLPPGMPPNELPVTLVSSGGGARLRLRIQAPADLPAAPQAMLFLRSRTALASQPVPVPGVLAAGSHTVECVAPPGEYELGVVPQGWLTCDDRDARVAVAEGGGDHTVRLLRSAATTKVTLKGLPAEALPVQVSLRAVDGIQAPHSELLFCGPYHWRTASESVALGAAPARLVAVGKAGAWTATEPVAAGAATAELSLLRAVEVHVRWLRVDVGEPVVLSVRSGSVHSRVQLARDLVVLQGDPVVAWAGREVVPAGDVALECVALAGGGVLWSAQCRAERGTVLVTVDERRGNHVAVVAR